MRFCAMYLPFHAEREARTAELNMVQERGKGPTNDDYETSPQLPAPGAASTWACPHGLQHTGHGTAYRQASVSYAHAYGHAATSLDHLSLSASVSQILLDLGVAQGSSLLHGRKRTRAHDRGVQNASDPRSHDACFSVCPPSTPRLPTAAWRTARAKPRAGDTRPNQRHRPAGPGAALPDP